MIYVKYGVKIKTLPWEMILVLLCIAKIGKDHNIVMTGKDDPSYPEGKVHARGYAMDFHRNPSMDTVWWKVHQALLMIDEGYVVLMDDDQHKDHVHVGYAPDKANGA